MKTNARLFLLLTVFYAVDAGAYFFLSLMWQPKHGGFEVIGTAALAMLAVLSGFIYFYVNKSANNLGATPPEDNLNGNIEDGDSEIGFFSPWSWWPFFLGLFGAITFASLAVGWWLTFIGVPLALVALIGFVFEYSRGQHAH
ncbi:MAG: cytochrome c oxidase subunit 4 [Micrococcales bacterium]